MKTLHLLNFALVAIVSAQAQGLRPEAVNGAAIGAVAGAVIGNNSGSLGHNAWRGAAYGAGAGLLIGSAVGESNRRAEAHRPFAPSYYHRPFAPSYYHRPFAPSYYHRPFAPSYYHRPFGGYGYGTRVSYGYWPQPVYYRPYVYRREPVVYYDSSDYYVASRPNYAGSGLFLGALAGAIIGNNSGSLGHNAWRGAAYGAGAGLLLGSIAEGNARRREAAAESVANSAPVQPAPAANVGQQATTIINNNYYNTPAPATPMSAANAMFGRN
jgi:uncharacterized protein YcfJ